MSDNFSRIRFSEIEEGLDGESRGNETSPFPSDMIYLTSTFQEFFTITIEWSVDRLSLLGLVVQAQLGEVSSSPFRWDLVVIRDLSPRPKGLI